jgi:uncharacterized membrane protein
VQRALQASLLAASSAWCVLILLAPILSADAIYSFFTLICHQRPDRSFELVGAPLPVCIRCSSLYFGFLGGLLSNFSARPRLLRMALAATVLENVIARVAVDSEVARIVTACALGAAIAPFVREALGELSETMLTMRR